MSASGSASIPPDAWLNDPSAVLDELLEQQRATTEVLLAIGRSRFEVDPIFETVLDHAMRLCRADAGQIFIHEGEHYRLGWASGGSDEYRSMLATRRIPVGPGTLVGRVGLERRAVLSPDISTDPEYDTEEQRLRQRLGGFRTIVGVPIQSDDEVIGVISLWRHEVRPFTTREIQLATTFAAQGAIAIRNANLMRELDLRTKQLARSVEHLEGLNDVGQAVSSSLDLQEVLSTVVQHAVELSRTEGGSIFEFDDESREFRVRTAYGTSDELLSALRAAHIGLSDTFVGRATLSGAPMAVADIAAAPRDVHLDCLLRDGWKSIIAVPLLRDDRILGALVVRRRSTGAFPPQVTELLETFASQSVLAIHNARLFHELERQAAELEGWNRELEDRVAEQVAEIERMARLKRFLPPQLAELVVSSGDDSFLESHRREITVVFCDLCGFTGFAETSEPEVTMQILHQYHAALGELVHRFEGTLERFTGDGLMVFFNDPVLCHDPSVRAVRMAVAMRSRVGELAERWRRSGHTLGFAVGIAQGYATLGRVGFEARVDYAAIGSVTNLAARLCDAADDGQILVSQRVYAEVDELIATSEVRELQLKGFSRALAAHNIVALNDAPVPA